MTILINNIKKLKIDINNNRGIDSLEASCTENTHSELVQHDSDEDEDNEESDDDQENEEDESEDFDEENEGGATENSNSCPSKSNTVDNDSNTFREFISYNESSVYKDGGSSEESEEDYKNNDDNEEESNNDSNDDNDDDNDDSQQNNSDSRTVLESNDYESESPSISEFHNNQDSLNVILNSKIKLK